MTTNYDWVDDPTVAGVSAYDPDVLNECLMHLKYNNEKMPVGTLFPCFCSSSWVPENALPVDGAEYLSTQFPSLWSDFLTSTTPRLATCSYTEYASDIATYGQCARFAVDIENGKFKVPTIKDGAYITQANSDAEIAKAYNESLPNIKGAFESTDWMFAPNMSGNGAFSVSSGGKYTTNDQKTSDGGYNVSFNASNSSSVYADNAKVQGDNVRLRWFVVVANGTVSQSAMDWSAWTTSMAQKLNKDHSNDEKPYVTEVSNESLMPSWYRVWSDGWCEQGGRFTTATSNSTYTVELLKAMSDTDYQVSLASISQSAGIWISDNNQMTTNHFKVYVSSNAGGGVHWQVRGYINQRSKMEIKAQLNKPFSESAKINFIVLQNHKNGYTIEETDNALLAWGKSDEEKLEQAKLEKQAENTAKAKLAVENGHVVFKGAEFETNAQTVGDLTATMLLMQAGGVETYLWLSKDDQAIELSLADFGTLGGLIAEFKNTIWQEKYLAYKTAIEQAETLEAVKNIAIEY